ncbi:hypothetical protein C7Y66_08445 [Chroococcidiopsis sp. CCALA 051]|uniref:DUF4340 domain-containing protein n=1 Tax=Chroococcidiopsis sp. CCALA 051 TaxID=869949 RepID=UPI000D0D9A90|nr:hypothetical protein C7Y66_08445 [Chroococcidiopsis sp. CCALA 051]
MKLQRTTLILLLLALGMGGFVYFYEIQGTPQRQEVREKQQQIFTFKEDQVQSLNVKTRNQTLQFERAKDSKTGWRMQVPDKASASEGAIAYLLDLLVSSKSDRVLTVPAAQLSDYGLQQPQATVEVKLQDGKTHRLVLGQPDFNRSFLYAQADPPTPQPAQTSVLLVSTNFENAVNRPLAEWKQASAPPKKSPEPQTNSQNNQK